MWKRLSSFVGKSTQSPNRILSRSKAARLLYPPTSSGRLPGAPLRQSEYEMEEDVNTIVDLDIAIQQLRKAREERNSLEARLHQISHLHTLSMLANGAIHDLCNFLMIIQSSGELLLQDLSPAEQEYESKTILLATQEATKLIRQVLAWNQSSLLGQNRCEATKLVATLAPLLRRLLPAQIELALHLTNEDITIDLAPVMLGQIILNLVMNARDAMPSGGTLTIETAAQVLEAHAHADTADPQAQRYLVVRVKDTGIGMDQGTLNRLFEPLFTTKGTKGNGLGLATVRWIVEHARGHLHVASELGHGASFTIYLPV